MKKICFRCHKVIKAKSNYYRFTEFDKGNSLNDSFAHRTCWDNFLKKLSTLEPAQNLLQRINLAPLEKMGLLKPQTQIVNMDDII